MTICSAPSAIAEIMAHPPPHGDDILAFRGYAQPMTSATQSPHILVDADACPVKEEVVKVAARHGLIVTFVSNGGLRPSRDPMVRHVVVAKSADAADDWIVENTRKNDIVVTADIPLAARTVAIGAHVLGPTGRPFTPESIGMAVAMRDLKQHLRETGESKGYNAGFSPRDRSAFLSALDQAVRRALKSPAT